jgi:uncharacterized radical SAM superfamily Fe-S cluster-containing enzyme
MIQNINIKEIVTMMRIMPKEHNTETIKIAKGKYQLPTNIGSIIKKLKNG